MPEIKFTFDGERLLVAKTPSPKVYQIVQVPEFRRWTNRAKVQRYLCSTCAHLNALAKTDPKRALAQARRIAEAVVEAEHIEAWGGHIWLPTLY